MTAPKLTFEYKITFGNIIQIAVVGLGIIAGWYSLVGSTSANSDAIGTLQRAVAPLDTFNTRLTVVESRAETADKRLDGQEARTDQIMTAINTLIVKAAETGKDVGFLRDWVEQQKRAGKDTGL